MMSESARMSSAAEARFRINRPNSRPRAIKVVALDRRAEPLVHALAADEWNGAAFYSAAELVAEPRRLAEQVDAADLVVMVATAGEAVPVVAEIGAACSRRRVTTTGLIVASADTPDEALSHTLAQLRPWMLMVVIATTTEYIADMLRALRA